MSLSCLANKVSVIIPVYNSAKTISECLDSVLPLSSVGEIICVDDGSTDSSLAVIQQYKDSRIVVLHKSNGGVSSARNLGLKFAKMPYVLFLDADDLYMSEESMNNILLKSAKNNLDINVFQVQSFLHPDADNFIKDRYHISASDGVMSSCEFFKMLRLRKESIGSSCRALYSRIFLNSNNLCFDTDLKICEDALFIRKAIINACRISVSPYPLLLRRVSSDSCIGSSSSYQKVVSRIDMCDKLMKYMGYVRCSEELTSLINQLIKKDMSFICRSIPFLSASEFDSLINHIMLLKSDFPIFRFKLFFNFRIISGLYSRLRAKLALTLKAR